jgi:hypothetical protein
MRTSWGFRTMPISVPGPDQPSETVDPTEQLFVTGLPHQLMDPMRKPDIYGLADAL